MGKVQNISSTSVTLLVLPLGLTFLVYYVFRASLIDYFTLCLLPFFIFILFLSIRKPIIGLFALFTFNYFFTPWYRYSGESGLSVWSDIFWWLLFIIIIINSTIKANIPWKRAANILTIGGLIWALYTTAEIINPTAVTEAWVFSRNHIYNTLLISLITIVLVSSYKQVRVLLIILSIFSLLAIIKALIQKYIGFDETEMNWLIESESYRTHLLYNSTRYFSFFTDAGNFGSNMGMVATLFFIIFIYEKQSFLKLYYFITAALALYAMFMSGTRGAMFVPIGGLLLFTLLNKNFKLICISVFLGLCIYVFFAHTYIGESNQMISRMRTAFKPAQDASYNVRKDNQKKLAEYLKHKPFGEGLGLGGVEARKYAYRVTTIIPHDSTYVKIWAETGIVGLILFLGIYVTSLLWGCYNIMFRIKNDKLRYLLTAIACSTFGTMISAYGNAFFLQFPTAAIIIIFLAILQNGYYIDQKITKNNITI